MHLSWSAADRLGAERGLFMDFDAAVEAGGGGSPRRGSASPVLAGRKSAEHSPEVRRGAGGGVNGGSRGEWFAEGGKRGRGMSVVLVEYLRKCLCPCAHPTHAFERSPDLDMNETGAGVLALVPIRTHVVPSRPIDADPTFAAYADACLAPA